MKGMNCLTEMYSAVEAEVILEDDPSTATDEKFLSMLLSADKVRCGCVNKNKYSLIYYDHFYFHSY